MANEETVPYAEIRDELETIQDDLETQDRKEVRMNALRSSMPQHLRTFVEPQTEQLSIKMEPIRCGLYGRLPDALGEGFLWTVPLGDDCLVSRHSLRLKEPLVLEERPTDFSCIFSGSRATFLSLPGTSASSSAETENLAAFSQAGGTERCLMQAGVLYESTSITYTPEYFEKLAKAFPGDFDDADETMRSFDPANPPAEMRFILRSFSPERAALPGAAPFFHAKALEALGVLLSRSDIDAGTRARQKDRALVERAEALISARFAEPLTARSIARELYVSRSRLCEAFRQVHGAGVAELLREKRMEAAQQMLAEGEADIADVAQAVGYARASSFDEAFRRKFGCAPTRWRQMASRR